MNKWIRYFEKLLNKKFSSEEVDQCRLNICMVNLIREEEEAWRDIRKMKNRKAVGLDGILVEDWKVLGRLGMVDEILQRVISRRKNSRRLEKELCNTNFQRKRRFTGM